MEGVPTPLLDLRFHPIGIKKIYAIDKPIVGLQAN